VAGTEWSGKRNCSVSLVLALQDEEVVFEDDVDILIGGNAIGGGVAELIICTNCGILI